MRHSRPVVDCLENRRMFYVSDMPEWNSIIRGEGVGAYANTAHPDEYFAPVFSASGSATIVGIAQPGVFGNASIGQSPYYLVEGEDGEIDILA